MTRRDHAEAARSLFAEIVAASGLRHQVEDPAPIEVLWRFPVQRGLSAPMAFGLQNGDELNLGIGDLWSTMFPFEKAQHDFRRLARGFIGGACRICEWRRGGVLYKRTLEEPDGDGWRTAYTEFTWALPVLFGERRVSCITNAAAGELTRNDFKH